MNGTSASLCLERSTNNTWNIHAVSLTSAASFSCLSFWLTVNSSSRSLRVCFKLWFKAFFCTETETSPVAEVTTWGSREYLQIASVKSFSLATNSVRSKARSLNIWEISFWNVSYAENTKIGSTENAQHLLRDQTLDIETQREHELLLIDLMKWKEETMNGWFLSWLSVWPFVWYSKLFHQCSLASLEDARRRRFTRFESINRPTWRKRADQPPNFQVCSTIYRVSGVPFSMTEEQYKAPSAHALNRWWSCVRMPLSVHKPSKINYHEEQSNEWHVLFLAEIEC